MQKQLVSSAYSLAQLDSIGYVESRRREFLHSLPPANTDMKLTFSTAVVGLIQSNSMRGWYMTVLLRVLKMSKLSNSDSQFQRFSISKLSIVSLQKMENQVHQIKAAILQGYIISIEIYKSISAIILVKVISQQQPPMDDLPLILASKDLFLSLSTLKIKTLKQAEQHLQSHQNQKVRSVVEHYHRIQHKIFQSLQDSEQFIDLDAVNMNFTDEMSLNYYWNTESVIEIVGQKGSGKTALALRLAVQYAQKNHQNTIKILNCAGGITLMRLKELKDRNYQYVDIFSIQELQQMTLKLRKSQKVGLLVLDGVVNLILGATSHINALGQWLSSLRQAGWTIIFTNLIQGKLEIEEKEVMNSMGYFPNLFGGIVDLRLRIDPHQSKEDVYLIRTLKTLNIKPYIFTASMSSQGLSQLILQHIL